MDRHALLDIAAPQLPDVPHLLGLVKNTPSETVTESRYQQARARYQAPRIFRHTMHTLYYVVAVLFCSLVTVGAFVENSHLRDAILGVAAGSVGVYALWFLVRLNWLERHSDAAWYHVYLLRPAEGLRAAGEAQALLATGDALVKAWHALATADGRVLRRFDVAVMQALYRSTGQELPSATCFDLLARRQVPYACALPAESLA